MNVLLVRANPRKDGMTQRVTDLFLEGLHSAGASVDDVDLCSMAIRPCIGCHRCHLDLQGACIHDDDMAQILPKVLTADTLVCCTPLYHYSMSAYLKIFLERTFPLMAAGIGEGPDGTIRNRPRYPEQWKNKKLAYVAVGALREAGDFEPLARTLSLVARNMCLQFSGGIVRPEAYFLQFRWARPKALAAVEAAIARAGRELGETGEISEAAQQAAGALLTRSQAEFTELSDRYWAHAEALGAKAQSLDALREAVGSDLRVLMAEMAKNVDPVATARVRAVLQFDFADQNLHFRFVIDKGTCSCEAVESAQCDLRVVASSEAWRSLYSRRASARELLTAGGIRLVGDKSLFSRLERFFPPPSS